MADLKRCPFCGGEASLSDSAIMQGGIFKWAVECFECGVITSAFGKKERAIEAWNRRYTPSEIDFDYEAEDE